MKLLWFTVISVFCITNGTATNTASMKTTKTTSKSTGTTPTSPQVTSTTQPTLHFSCQKNNESGKVDIKLENLGIFGANVSVITGDSTCKLDSSTLKNCTLGKNIEIKIVHRGKEPRMVRKKDVSRFRLSCTDASYQLSVQTNININGQLGTVTNLKPKTIPPTDHLKSGDFSMSITPIHTPVELGANLTVTITENTSNIPYMVQTCTAIDDKSGFNTSLWSSCKSDSEVFTGEWVEKSEEKSKLHTLEAFTFNDNNKVNISCTLLVCPNKEECKAKVCKSTESRKRRSASSSETRTVSASFSVKDDDTLESANAATGNRETLNTLMFVMLPSAIALRTIFART